MTLPSNTADSPTNTASDYRVKLPFPLELKGDWEMALVEIHYPHSWDNITDEVSSYEEITQNSFLVRLAPISPFKGGGLLLRYAIPPGCYDTIEGFVDAINSILAEWKFDWAELVGYNLTLPAEELKATSEFYRRLVKKEMLLKLEYLDKSHRVKFHNHPAYTINALFSPLLQYVLGLASDRWVEFKGESDLISKYPPDLTAGFNTLYIYCNLIESQVVGNSLAPLLRTVTIEGGHGDFLSKIFLSPHYVKLRTKTFDSVETQIKTDTGEAVTFRFGKVILKLHLRKS